MPKLSKDQHPDASPLDIALHVEGVSPEIADIARSIYAQESSSGKNARTSNAGAVGGMQVIPATFQRVADKGWDINDPVHNARAGVRYISKLNARAGGDPALTAVGYYGGEGAQDKAKRGIAVSDPRNPGAPNTLQYANQVVGRIPVSKQPASALQSASEHPDATPEEIAEYVRRQGVQAKPQQGQASAPEKKDAKSQKRSVGEELLRQAGLTVRHGIAGVASLPAMASDAVTGVINAGADLVVGKGNGPRFMPAGEALQRTMTAAGLPAPENATERVIGDATSAAAGAGGLVKGAQILSKSAGPVASAVGKTLAKGAGGQVVSGMAGSGASSYVRENGGGAGAQIAAGLAGSLVPAGAVGFAKEGLVRGALRGGEAGRKRVAENVEIFKQAGTTPTLGQATEGRVARAAESLLARTPGGAGVIAKRAQSQADEMAAAVQKLSDELAPGASAVNAGEAIERGVRSFKDGFKIVQNKLYQNLDQHIQADTPVDVSRTQKALADLNADIPGAPNLSQWFKSAKIQGIDKALQADLDAASAAAAAGQPSSLPYMAIKKLRTLVGNEISDNSLVADVPRSKWSALYGALSEDLGVAAKNAGPKAEDAWKWANTYTKTQLDRLDKLSSIVGKDSPEKIFNAATSGTAEGATIVKRVIDALPKQERREVAAAVIQRLGRATPGQQNAMGDAFSSETFLSNLSKLSPAARAAIFGRTDRKGIEAQIGAFAKLAESRREGGRVFANPSGTAAGVAQLGTLASVGGTVATGNPALVAIAAGVPALAHGAAKAVTSPKLVASLGQKTPIPEQLPGATLGAIQRTGSATEQAAEIDPGEHPDATPEEIEQYLRSQPGAAVQGAPADAMPPGPAQPGGYGADQQEQPSAGDAAPELQEIAPSMLRMNPQGAPFSTQRAAMIDAERSGGVVVPVDGGFAVMPDDMEAPDFPGDRSSVDGPESRMDSLSMGATSGDILNPAGAPFQTQMAARLAAQKSPGQIIEAPGGYVIRPQEIANENTDAHAIAPEAAAQPQGAEQASGGSAFADAGIEAGGAAFPGSGEPDSLEAMTHEQDTQQSLDGIGQAQAKAEADAAPAPVAGVGSSEFAGVPAEGFAGGPSDMEAAGLAEFEQRTAIDTTQSDAMREQAQYVRETQSVAEGGPLSRAGNAGVEAGAASLEAQADALDRAQQRAVASEIFNPLGEPFRTLFAARRVAEKFGGEVVPVDGGFVVQQV